MDKTPTTLQTNTFKSQKIVNSSSNVESEIIQRGGASRLRPLDDYQVVLLVTLVPGQRLQRIL